MAPLNLRARVKGWALSGTLRIMQWTWRLQVEGWDEFNRLLASEERFILCFWHGKYVPILPLFQGRKAHVFTSVSRRGDVIAQICRNFGYGSSQIPDHGGEKSLRLMENALTDVKAAGIAVDGPLGPYHEVKPGVIHLASKLSFFLLPISVYSLRKQIFKERWDLMEVPRLFTRVCVVIGDPIRVPPSLNSEETVVWSSRLAQSLELLDTAAESILLGPEIKANGAEVRR